MRLLAVALCVAAIMAPSAAAKGGIAVVLADNTPRVGQPFTCLSAPTTSFRPTTGFV